MKTIALITLAIICMFMLSCGKKATEPEPEPIVYSYIRGCVRHAVFGFPIKDVKLSSTTDPGYWTGTSASGIYSHTYTDSGYKDIKFTCYGFIDSILTFTLASGDSLNVDINLRRKVPDSSHAFFNPGIPVIPFSPLSTLPYQTGCMSYPDSLVIWSTRTDCIQYGWTTYHTIVINLLTPVSTGTIDLADSTLGFMGYRRISGWSGNLTTTIFATNRPGGSGQLNIIGFDPVNKTIEGYYHGVSLIDDNGVSHSVQDCDFIGHW